ncbi:Cof-type HAD-IIB family hydrolase [Petroclostridium sp. X23]|uniref:Cof-type HAD-IIB family hydrolase n=1 Tax=Petroclostridium sp. X23 TaxID=3045146 RepID=UPI0024AD7AD5|nr:Cof-type HAD-IIB family hydrolase [Petroclostridium sp. X23]WHH60721.1 Cof-type HAD-IIB family hydrolase [Petroclostridium sp. X23]
MDIKLVAIDLDGTLLNTEKEISQKNIDIIARVMKKGIKVVICSGRIFMGARIYSKIIGTQEPIIACNGATIRSVKTGENIHEELMDVQDCKEVVRILRENNIYFHAYIGDSMVAERLEFSTLRYSKINERFDEEDRVDIKIVDDVWESIQKIGEPVTKFVIMCDDVEYLESVRTLFGDMKTIEIASSDKNNFEIMKNGVSKGKALKILAEHFGYAMDQVMAIGDNENDISMMKAAGFAVAMENGWDEVKSLADFVTLNHDQDGVAYALEKFLL